MIEDISFQVATGGVRLDAALLSRFPTSTRAFCREACAAGEVIVDGRPALKGMKLSRGAQVLAISGRNNRRLAAQADDCLFVPEISAIFSAAVFAQNTLLITKI